MKCPHYLHVDWTLPVPLNLVHLVWVYFFRFLYLFITLFFMGGGIIGVVVVVVSALYHYYES